MTLNEFTKSALKGLELSDLYIQVTENFASTKPNHREKIRKEIQKKFNISLDDLSPPTLSSGFVSISHSKLLGGYAFSQSKQLGLDIEETSRLTESVVQRISGQNERELVGDFWQSLWSIKESAYKALLGAKQPEVMSQIEINTIETHNTNALIFYGSFQEHKVTGLCSLIDNEDCIVSIAACF